MPPEKKVIATAAIVTLVSCFLPWYGINSRVINEWWNAFGSIGSVAGYVVLSFSVAILAIILLPVLKPQMDIKKKLPFRESSLLIFFSGQSFFISLIFIPVYSQYSLINATNSGTRFGIYLALLSTLISTIVALAYQRKNERLSLQEDFATVPRTQRNINDWDAENEEEPQLEEAEEEIEQEAMFDGSTHEPEEKVEQELERTSASYQDNIFQ